MYFARDDSACVSHAYAGTVFCYPFFVHPLSALTMVFLGVCTHLFILNFLTAVGCLLRISGRGYFPRQLHAVHSSGVSSALPWTICLPLADDTICPW